MSRPLLDTIRTARVAELIDPEEQRPPAGVKLLVVTRGGVLSIGTWSADCLAWGYLPRIPESVKRRQIAEIDARLIGGNRQDNGEIEGGSMRIPCGEAVEIEAESIEVQA